LKGLSGPSNATVEVMTLQHPLVKHTRQTTDLEGRFILVIETDLPILPDDPAFDAKAFRELENAAQSYLYSNPVYDDFRIRAAKK
jgi:hypothetical protein